MKRELVLRWAVYDHVATRQEKGEIALQCVVYVEDSAGRVTALQVAVPGGFQKHFTDWRWISFPGWSEDSHVLFFNVLEFRHWCRFESNTCGQRN